MTISTTTTNNFRGQHFGATATQPFFLFNFLIFWVSNQIEAAVLWAIALTILAFEAISTPFDLIWFFYKSKVVGTRSRLKKAHQTLTLFKNNNGLFLTFEGPGGLRALFSIFSRWCKVSPRLMGLLPDGHVIPQIFRECFVFLRNMEGEDIIMHFFWDFLCIRKLVVRRIATAVEIFPYRSMKHEPDYDADIRDLVPLNEALSFFSDFIFTTVLYYTGYFVIGLYIYSWQKGLVLAGDGGRYHPSPFTSLIFELNILNFPIHGLFLLLSGPSSLKFYKKRWWKLWPRTKKLYFIKVRRRLSARHFFVMVGAFGDTWHSSYQALYFDFWPKYGLRSYPELWGPELVQGAFTLLFHGF